MKNNHQDFEENLDALDEIVKSLENGEFTLSEALSAFENGISLYKKCHQVLEAADARVKVLIEDSELGEMVEINFGTEGD